MKQSRFRLIFLDPRRREIEVDENTSRADNTLWRDAQRLLRRRVYKTPEGVVEIEIYTKALFKKFSKDKYQNDLAEMDGVIRYSGELRSEIHYIQCYLEELFLILNIAVPGSCRLWLKESMCGDCRGDFGDFRLYGDLFEVAWGARGEFSQISSISLAQVVDWFRELGVGSRTKAESAIEQALFSLLRLSAVGDVEVDSVIWLSQILESLCGSPSGKILSTIEARLGLIFKPLSPVEMRDLKKKLDSFYNMRSRFVHGDFKVLRRYPRNLSFDDEVSSYVYKIMGNIDFGGYLSVALIQKFVREGWRDVEFNEQMVASLNSKNLVLKQYISKEK